MMKSNLQNPAIECCHLKAATNATSAEIVELQEEHLSHLVSVKLISEKNKATMPEDEPCMSRKYDTPGCACKL